MRCAEGHNTYPRSNPNQILEASPPCECRLPLTPALARPLITRSPPTPPDKIQAQADGYAHEARRRLGAPPTTCADPSKKKALHAKSRVLRPSTAATAFSAKDFEGPSARSLDSDASPEQHGSFGVTPAGTGGDVGRARQASGTGALESGDESARICSDDGGGSSSSGAGACKGRGRTSRSDQHHAESAVFAMLEASLRCRHGWLCQEAFGEAATMMGGGDGEGLPAPPRELTAVIGLLQRFLSLSWVAGGRHSEDQEVEFRERSVH